MNQVAAETKGRGRPRSEEKAREIMCAATELFTQNGYEHTSVDDIGARAGVSKQTVYSHYGSKENLFALAVSNKCKTSGINPDAIDLDVPPEIMLPILAERFLNLITSPEAVRVYALCTGSAETHPELGRLFFEHGPLQTKQAVEEYLAAQRDAGRLAIEDVGQAAWQLLSMLKSEAHMRIQFNLEPLDEDRQAAYVKSCVEMFLRAYSP